MQLTPEQEQRVRSAKAAGQNRVQLEFTPDQRRDWQAAVDEELAGKAENIAHLQKIQTAARQPGFFGDVRRAIAIHRLPLAQLAEQIGVAPRVLSDFRAGEADLPAPALDRLIETLGLRLMQEIPG